MKTVQVPAEIMGVRDTIMGKLTIEQLGLLLLAGVIMVYVYAVVPPQSSITVQKAVVGMCTLGIAGAMAWKKGDLLVIEWLGLRMAYWLRPRVWMYEKGWGRIESKMQKAQITSKEEKVEVKAHRSADPLVLGLASSQLRLDFGRKGRLYVESK